MYSFATYKLDEFKQLGKEEWLEKMVAAHKEYEAEYPGRELSEDQIFAWKDCFDVLQRVLLDFHHPEFYIVFEYVLYSENGCRPDVLLVSGNQIFVLEFKCKTEPKDADIGQADMYERFISSCHLESRGKKVITCLVLTRSEAVEERINGSIHFVSEVALKKLINKELILPVASVDIAKWQASMYEPDKNSLERMVDMFEHGKLPHLKSAQSSKIPVASSFLKALTAAAKRKREHWLCVVSGVPGAGKTLLGIQYIYEMRRADSHFQEANATYVSGNGPLLKVLQGQLKYPTFLMSAPSFVKAYNQRRLSDTELLVFDEAQRMWSKERMMEKNRGNFSENEQIIQILSHSDWGILVALIGEGQEIYAGEDGGIDDWVKAVPANWKVVCSNVYADRFKGCAAQEVKVEPSLHLDVSIRSQGAEQVSRFVNTLLDGNIAEAKKLYEGIKQHHFRFYRTHDFLAAKEYCRKLYQDRDDKRYGCITSSQNIKLKKDINTARWFNDEPTSPASCCQMKVAQSEFDVEGLELDMPILGWLEDLQWDGSSWVPHKKYGKQMIICQEGTPDYRYRINTYRVFLTRGRDGLLIYVPDREALRPVYRLLEEVGIEELKS